MSEIDRLHELQQEKLARGSRDAAVWRVGENFVANQRSISDLLKDKQPIAFDWSFSNERDSFRYLEGRAKAADSYYMNDELRISSLRAAGIDVGFEIHVFKCYVTSPDEGVWHLRVVPASYDLDQQILVTVPSPAIPVRVRRTPFVYRCSADADSDRKNQEYRLGDYRCLWRSSGDNQRIVNAIMMLMQGKTPASDFDEPLLPEKRRGDGCALTTALVLMSFVALIIGLSLHSV